MINQTGRQGAPGPPAAFPSLHTVQCAYLQLGRMSSIIQPVNTISAEMLRGYLSMVVLKKPGEDRPSTARKRRLWSIAPVPSPPVQWFEGYQILEELSSELGMSLFEWLRGVLLWNAVGEQHVGLFQPSTATSLPKESFSPELLTAQSVFGELLSAPHRVRREALGSACSEVSEWASRMGLPATAAQFAEATALLLPHDPDLCFRAGRANRRNVEFQRAVLWFHRGTGVARRAGNWTAYIDCWLGWGNLEIARGNFAPAERLLYRAYRAATKYNIPDLAAAARHDLFMLAVDQQRFADAYAHASAALALYAPSHPSYPYLVHDLAQTWALDGYGALALPLLIAVRRVITVPGAQLQIAGNIAGAAGQIRNIDTFFSAWDYVSSNGTKPAPYVAAALASVAEGAYCLRLHRQAAEAATKALRFAQERQEPTEERRALKILENLRLGEAPPDPREPPPELRPLAESLIANLTERTEQG